MEFTLHRRSHWPQVGAVLHHEWDPQTVLDGEGGLLLQGGVTAGGSTLGEHLVKTCGDIISLLPQATTVKPGEVRSQV